MFLFRRRKSHFCCGLLIGLSAAFVAGGVAMSMNKTARRELGREAARVSGCVEKFLGSLGN